MDLFRCHGSILIYIFVVLFCFTLVCLDLSFDFFGIGLCCFELVPDVLVMVLLFVFRSWFIGYDLVKCS